MHLECTWNSSVNQPNFTVRSEPQGLCNNERVLNTNRNCVSPQSNNDSRWRNISEKVLTGKALKEDKSSVKL